MLPHYSCSPHSSYGAASAYFCTAPMKRREGQRNRRAWVSRAGSPLRRGLSQPQAGPGHLKSKAPDPAEYFHRPGAQRHPLAGPGILAHPPNPCPSHRFPHTNTTQGGAKEWAGILPAFYWLSLLSIIITPPQVVVLVIAICRAVTSPTGARSALIPLRAVCKGNTAVNRAAGRSQ